VAGKPDDEDNANKVGGACGQGVNHAVDRTRRQVYIWPEREPPPVEKHTSSPRFAHFFPSSLFFK
jgi:hypothetical protein